MKLIRTVLSSVALIAAVVAVPAVASAQEADHRQAPPAYGQVGRDHDRDRDDWRRDRWEQEERSERMDHERMCRSAYERGASPWELGWLGCSR